MDASIGPLFETEAFIEDEALAPQRPSLLLFVHRFARNKLAVFGAIIILLMIVMALAAPLLAPFSPNDQNYNLLLHGPIGRHLVGTDELGRDELSRIIYGARVSLEASVFSVAIALVIGVPLGLFAGYYRGPLEGVIMRAVDAVQSFPFIVFTLALAAVLGPSLRNAIIAIGIGFVPGFVRIVRAQVLTVANLEYVQSARAIGDGDLRILRYYVLPNSMSPLLVQTTLAMAGAILGEAALSFLGLGTQPPTPSWGQMLATAQTYGNLAPWLTYAPGAAIFLAVLAFNLFGDGVREALDPRMRI